MKKKLLLMALAMCCMNMAFAQEKRVKVTGDVTDYETSEPIMAATVQLLSLPDSAFQTGGTTDLKGQFDIEHRMAVGNYLLKVSFVGYGDTYRHFTVSEETRRVRLDHTDGKVCFGVLEENI